MEHGVVIVGGSIAGHNVATTLRKEGYEHPITIINQQDTLPYDVSKLSKSWMLDVDNETPPLFKDEDFFKEEDISIRLGTIIKELHPEEKKITTNTDEEIQYDTLVLATGSVLRTLKVPGSEANGIFYLRDFEHALKIKKWAKKAKDVVIVGAGFIGMELASSFAQLGLNISVIELAKYPLGRVLGEEVSRYFTKMHEDHGVRFFTEEGLDFFKKDSDGSTVAAVTNTGKEIPCEMAIIGIGVTPNTSLSHPDLKVDRGYVINEYGETTIPDVYAVGDCTVWPYQGNIVHVEHWEHAYNHGQAIAKNIIQPKSNPYTVRPYFWTDQYDQTFDYLGHALSWDKILVRGSMEDKKFTVAYVDNDNYPIAILTANKADKRKAIEKFMDENRPIDEEMFKDLNNPL